MVISFKHNDKTYLNYNIESDEFATLAIPDAEKLLIVKNAKTDIVRKDRNDLLAQTDWTQMPDAPLATEKKTEFAEYRQALRDITNNLDNPNEVTWPTPPTL
ncbi:tail fiber assembly protein [Pseudoalteromonas phenolica]|uniref:tail fiber assembly protein n=1 Tax=Pseudoalteromonas phenolica TaxID=161398 RepID=UPI00384BDDB4